jgi:ferredoxin
VSTRESWRVEVSRSCVGTGQCTAAAPEHFLLVDGRSRPAAADIAPSDSVMMAAELCPVGAIMVRDLETGRALVINED